MSPITDNETPSATKGLSDTAGQGGAAGIPGEDWAQSLFGPLLTLIVAPESDSNTGSSRYEGFDGSTARLAELREVERRASTVFASAEEEVFEDGVESSFSRKLATFVWSYGKAAIDAIGRFIISDSANREVASEALRVVGRIRQPSTHRDRLWLLEHGLCSSSARVRDGAALGLAFLDDPLAVVPLRLAVEREQIPELREDMQQVLDQLEETARWHSS